VTATFGSHARAEAVGAFAFQDAGLKCSFHNYVPIEYRWKPLAADSVDKVPGQKKGGLFYLNVAINSIAGAVFLRALLQ